MLFYPTEIIANSSGIRTPQCKYSSHFHRESKATTAKKGDLYLTDSDSTSYNFNVKISYSDSARFKLS